MARRARAAIVSEAANSLATAVVPSDAQPNTNKGSKGKKRTLDAATAESAGQNKVYRLTLSV
jgi:hypothetical protein